jgi:hypothetical protein
MPLTQLQIEQGGTAKRSRLVFGRCSVRISHGILAILTQVFVVFLSSLRQMPG